MLSISICYAAQDAAIAGELSAYIERNFGAVPDRAPIGLQHGLLEAVDIALSTDIAILLASPASVHGLGSRHQWAPVLIDGPERHGSLLISIELEPCGLPGLLRRKNFFDARADRLTAFRALKMRFIEAAGGVRPESSIPHDIPCTGDDARIESLRCLVCDAPGIARINDPALAHAFAVHCADEFEFTLWIDCQARSPVSVAGEIGARLKTADYSSRRGLIVLEDPACGVESVVQSGLTSTLIVAGNRPRPAPSASALQAALTDFLNGRGGLIDEAALYRASRQPAGGELAMFAFRYFRRQDRMPEALEALDIAERSAIADRDARLLEDCRRERRWIHGHAPPTIETAPAQLAFNW